MCGRRCAQRSYSRFSYMDRSNATNNPFVIRHFRTRPGGAAGLVGTGRTGSRWHIRTTRRTRCPRRADDLRGSAMIAGDVLLEGSFTLDATTTPRSMTWVDSMGADQGKSLPASYVLAGDDFVFIAGHEGVPRPTVFHTEPGQTMRTFGRRRSSDWRDSGLGRLGASGDVQTERVAAPRWIRRAK